MDLSFLSELNLPPWDRWVGPVIGFLTGGLTLLVGRKVVRWLQPRRKTQMAPAGAGKDPFLHGGAGDQRVTVRRKGNPVEILVSDAAAAVEPYRGLVVDRSMGGLCLSLPSEVDVGTVLSVRLRQGPESTPWVKVQVTHCNADRGGYSVGCRFLRTPTWNVLLLFG